MKKYLCIISILLVCTLLLTACTDDKKPTTKLKLTDHQAALAESFLRNMDVWEMYDGLYCADFHVYDGRELSVICGYSTYPHTRKDSGFSILKSCSFTVTDNSVVFSHEVSNASLLPGNMLNAYARDDEGNLRKPDPPASVGPWGYNDSFDEKKAVIESLFINVK